MGKYKGRKATARAKMGDIQELKTKGLGASAIASQLGISRGKCVSNAGLRNLEVSMFNLREKIRRKRQEEIERERKIENQANPDAERIVKVADQFRSKYGFKDFDEVVRLLSNDDEVREFINQEYRIAIYVKQSIDIIIFLYKKFSWGYSKNIRIMKIFGLDKLDGFELEWNDGGYSIHEYNSSHSHLNNAMRRKFGFDIINHDDYAS